jgi:hypothetical protein
MTNNLFVSLVEEEVHFLNLQNQIKEMAIGSQRKIKNTLDFLLSIRVNSNKENYLGLIRFLS